MRQRLSEARRKESGFTLVELLIVIVILGILAGVVVFAVGAFTDRGEKSACKADVKAVEVAVEAYRAKTGNLPPNLGALVPEYLRQTPPTQTITVNGPNASVGNRVPDGNQVYYVTYWLNGRTASGGLPSLPPGAVTGDIASNSTVTFDCSN